ncbi:hypothetical protein [Polycladomyces zharkentensis]|nr:hypothetical protein [Polycladomyces sp. WAk]
MPAIRQFVSGSAFVGRAARGTGMWSTWGSLLLDEPFPGSKSGH